MPHKPVAVVVAMRREVAPLLIGHRPTAIGGVEYFELESAVIAVGGIGKVAAERAANALIEKYSPGVLVSAGVAGALTDALKVGDVVHARGVVDVGAGERFAADGEAGTIATVSSVSGPDEKRLLAQRWHADVVDMEASAIAQVARENGIEFAALKAISDELDFEMPPVGQFVNAAGEFQILRFAAYLALHPKWWGAVRKLNVASGQASVNLTKALQHLIDQRSHADSKRSKVETR